MNKTKSSNISQKGVDVLISSTRNSFVYYQKGVDMLLGIDMIGVVNEYKKPDAVVLLRRDSDFVLVIEKLKFMKIKTILLTYFERNRKSPFSKSNYLINSVDKFIKINKEDFEESIKNEK